MKFGTLVALSSVGAFAAGAGGYTLLPAVMASAAGKSCVIKGNISIGSHERIYHVPGQHYYADTIIRPEFGERWFCSENEAQAAGWRKAGY